MKISENAPKCGRYPLPLELNVENVYWQVLETSNGTIKMFNAYYDNRDFYKDEPLVRILAFINRVDPKVKTFCQLWFDGFDEPVIEPVFEYNLIWVKNWGVNSIGFQPHLIGCKNPLPSKTPLSVSLVEKKCGIATNHLKVIKFGRRAKEKTIRCLC